jgi:hypothetical protein
LVFGDWVKIGAGKNKIDIIFGERPGGGIAAILQLEEKGKTYSKASDGRPILPLFSTQDLTKKEKERIEASTWKISIDITPMYREKTLDKSVKKEDDEFIKL